jgi:hypothetical protein
VGVCTAVTRNGEPCTLQATGKNGLCWAHDPRNAEQRRQRAAKGGRGKQGSELRDLKAKVEKLADDVLKGKVEKGRAAVCNQLYNTLLRCIELERKIKEQEEVLQRIEALERRLDFSGRRGGRW